jgi:GNAT superfamily N-acetyltransferase
MTPTIRKAEDADAPAISELVTGLAHFFLPDTASQDAAAFLKTLSTESTLQRIQATNYCYDIAECAGQLVGILALRDDTHIYHLFVSPEHHRQGVATALWAHAFAESQRRIITVNSSIFAVPVYQRLGFSATGAKQIKNGVAFVPMRYLALSE